MDNIRRYSFKVESYDVDLTHRCSPLAMIGYILDSAGEDAQTLNFGLSELLGRGLSWVLSRLSVAFRDLPPMGECFYIDTWIESVGRIVSTRNFEIYNSKLESIGCASTQWAVIDMERREAVDLSSVVGYDSYVNAQRCDASPPRRIRSVEGAVQEHRQVRYSDIDVNLHTNTFCYLRWAMDYLPIETIKSQRLAQMEVNFVKESRYGDTLGMIVGCDGLNYQFEIQNQQQEPICRVRIGFE